jgi:hypothetical protein
MHVSRAPESYHAFWVHEAQLRLPATPGDVVEANQAKFFKLDSFWADSPCCAVILFLDWVEFLLLDKALNRLG